MKLLRKNKTLIIASAVFMAVLIITCIFNSVKSADYASWQPAEGVAASVEPVRNFKKRIEYTYCVGESEYSSSDTLHKQSDSIPEPGDQITVWFDEKDAARSSLSKPEVTVLDYIGPLFPATVFVIGLLLADRQRSNHN